MIYKKIMGYLLLCGLSQTAVAAPIVTDSTLQVNHEHMVQSINPSFFHTQRLKQVSESLPPFSEMDSLLDEQTHTCRGQIFNPVTDICWSCMRPITLGKHTLQRGKLPDTENGKKTLCICGDALHPRLGVAVGFWEPIAVAEVTLSLIHI